MGTAYSSSPRRRPVIDVALDSGSEQDSAPVIPISEELIRQLTSVGLLSPGQLIMGGEVLGQCDAVQHTGETR